MQLGSLLNALGGVPAGKKKGFVPAEIVSVPSTSEGNYTVKLQSTSTDVLVKLPQGSFAIGDKVEIPVQQLVQLPGSSEIPSDTLLLSQGTVDKISQLLIGDTGAELSESDKKVVQIALKLLGAFPKDIQEQIFKEISSPESGSSAGDKQNKIIRQLIQSVFEKIPEVLKNATAEVRAEIFSNLSDIVTPVISPKSSFEGVTQLPQLNDDIVTFSGLSQLRLGENVLKTVSGILTSVQKDFPISVFRYALTGLGEDEIAVQGQSDVPMSKVSADQQFHEPASPEVSDRNKVSAELNSQIVVQKREGQTKMQNAPVSSDDSLKKIFEQRLSLRAASPKVLIRLQASLNSEISVPDKVDATSLKSQELTRKKVATVKNEVAQQAANSTEFNKKNPVINDMGIQSPAAGRKVPVSHGANLGQAVKADIMQSAVAAEGPSQDAKVLSVAPETNKADSGEQESQSINTNHHPEPSNDISIAGGKSIPNELTDVKTAAGVYESVVSVEGYGRELQKFIASRFPGINALLPKIDKDFYSPKQITAEQLQTLEEKLQQFNLHSTEKSFLRAVVAKTFSALATDMSETIFPKIVSQIEPVSKVISEIYSIIDSVESDFENVSKESVPSPKMLKSVERIKSSLGEMQMVFDSAKGVDNSLVESFGVKKAGGLWGLFFENSLKGWSEGGEAPKETSIKQELVHINNEITKKMISYSVKNEEANPVEKSLLKNLSVKVSDAVQRIEGGQILAQPKETNINTREQVMWIPVQMGGEWTRLGIEFRREGKGSGKGGKLSNRVNIQMELKKLGTVSAELDLDAGKQLRVSLGASKVEAVTWFRENEHEIYESLDSEAIRSVILSIKGNVDGDDSERRRDSFQVTG